MLTWEVREGGSHRRKDAAGPLCGLGSAAGPHNNPPPPHPDVFSLRSRGFGQSNSLPTAGSAGAGLGRRNPRQFQIPSRNLPTARLGLLGPSGLLGTPQRSPAASPAILKQGRQVGHGSIGFLGFSFSNLPGFPLFKPKACVCRVRGYLRALPSLQRGREKG